jgi:hypothetical protein
MAATFPNYTLTQLQAVATYQDAAVVAGTFMNGMDANPANIP